MILFVMVIKVATGRCLGTLFKGSIDLMSSVAFSPDGKLALSGSFDKCLHLWDLATYRHLRTFEGHASQVKLAVAESVTRAFNEALHVAKSMPG